ncbi:MAG: hypothetical protein JWO85_2809 [Candidatus Eremiobacteraeota bacterium]|jgi:hypothetical protein|nr:hypothetical protein [Candidatus Eremiobacteraeota bacterium]
MRSLRKYVVMRKLLVLFAALLATVAPLPSAADARTAIAVLPLAAADSGLPYGLLPSRSELRVMTTQLRSGLGGGGISLVAPERMTRALAAANFDQTTPSRSCAAVECARRIGRAVRADTVVVGAVTRAMAVVWSTDFLIVDVATGRVIGEPRVGYKGDVQAMELGERDAGVCIARVIRGEKPCPPDPGW